MPTPTYDLIASNVLSSSASSVTFSSIPATYRDLVLVINAVSSLAQNRVVYARYNGDTGTNYSDVEMRGNGSTATSTSSTTDYVVLGSSGASSPASSIASIMDYSATDKHKTSLTRYGVGSALTVADAGRWANTSAISTILLYPSAGDFNSGSSFYLYGIVS